MDKRELNDTVQEIKNSYRNGEYRQVVAYADGLNLKKIKDPRVLDIISVAFEKCGRFEEAQRVLSSMCAKYGMNRQSSFRLCELSVKSEDLDKAVEYYNEFCRISPRDSGRFLLKYEIGKAGGIEKRELIKVLEAYTSREKDEKWEYELAKLYHEAGLENNCVKLCDDIFTWFADGEYVKKALELKFAHKALSPEQQRKYEEMMEQRIILDSPGRYTVNEPETSSHIETFEAEDNGESGRISKEFVPDESDEDDELVDTHVMSAEAVNREIDMMDEPAPKMTRLGADTEPGDDEPLPEELTISLAAAIAANTRETEKAAVLEAVLKAQELEESGQNGRDFFFDMKEEAPQETPEEDAEPEEEAKEEPGPAQIKLSGAQADKLGAAEIPVSAYARLVTKPDFAPAGGIKEEREEAFPPEAVNFAEDEIWLDPDLMFEEPEPGKEEVSDEESYTDEEGWIETPGPGPKLTKSADVSAIPMESSADGQIGIDLDMLTDKDEGIEGQMTIDEVFEQYAQKVKENENRYAQIEAERLKQIQDAVSDMVPTPLYEIEDEPEPESATRDITMNVTELFATEKSIESMLKAAETGEEEAGYDKEDISDVGIDTVDIDEEIEKRLAQSVQDIEDTVFEEMIPEETAAETETEEALRLEEDLLSSIGDALAAQFEADMEEETELEDVSDEELEEIFSELDKNGEKSSDKDDIEAALVSALDAIIEEDEEAQAGNGAPEEPEVNLADSIEEEPEPVREEAEPEEEPAAEEEAAETSAGSEFEALLAEFEAEEAAKAQEAQESEEGPEQIEEPAGESAENAAPEAKPERDMGETFRLSDIDEIMAALLESSEESEKEAEEEPELKNEEIKEEKPASAASDFELTEDLRKDLEEFLFIDGMEEAVCSAVSGISKRKLAGDVTGGNLIVTGDSKSGKTYLAVNIIKGVTGETGGGTSRIAKVQAQALNGKNIDKVFEKIGASDLIIENVGFLGDETVQNIIDSIKAGKPGGMVVFEGNQLAVENIFYTFPEARELFKARVDINELNIVQWSEIACKYAKKRGYVIDDMALLALHAKINEINLPTERLGYKDIIGIVDGAIQKADRRNVGKLFSAFSGRHGDGMKEITEADFE